MSDSELRELFGRRSGRSYLIGALLIETMGRALTRRESEQLAEVVETRDLVAAAAAVTVREALDLLSPATFQGRVDGRSGEFVSRAVTGSAAVRRPAAGPKKKLAPVVPRRPASGLTVEDRLQGELDVLLEGGS